MPCLGGDVDVHFEERRFNEQVVCALGEGYSLFDVLVMIGDVDHVSDFLPARYAQGVLSENAKGIDRSPSMVIRLSSGAPCRTALLAARSHGPTGSPSRLSPSLQTLTRSFSWKAKARHGMPWSSKAPSMRNSPSSTSTPGDRRTAGMSRRRKASRARNSHTRSKPDPLNSLATIAKSTDCASRRFKV